MEDAKSGGDLATLLKPFHDRAKLAEDRLAKLEAALEAKEGPGSGADRGLLDSLLVLRAKLEAARAEQVADREKASKEAATALVENQKLRYQVTHLKRSLEEADKKMLQATAN